MINGVNIMVNKNSTVADDRGIDFLLFSPGHYNGTDAVEISFI